MGNIVIRDRPVSVLRQARRTRSGSVAVEMERPEWPEKVVTLKLNQQQIELVDRTIAKGVAPDRASLVRLALREYAAKRAATRPEASR